MPTKATKEPQLCKKCSPPHYHLDHAYSSYLDELDKDDKPVVTHVYSCRICSCETRFEGSLEAFKGKIIEETGIQM